MAKTASKTLSDLSTEITDLGDKKNTIPYVVLHEDDVVRLVVKTDDTVDGRVGSAKDGAISWTAYLFTIEREGIAKPIRAYLPLGVFFNSPYEGNGYTDAERRLIDQRGTDNAIFADGLVRKGNDVVKNLKDGVVVSRAFVSEPDEKTGRVRRCYIFNTVKKEAKTV